ncbi:DHH phosphoesterase [Glarea lozoyensis ATCC 20868]|uniref:DHH phosphoesterase n=1 Tax=Glarea lozoyensis (strain ATCC 20868 / MF5171) TaxID=1116229 RepID=S3CCV4_GLAL2|nr:DHH phosphoesterase [Glarea lozoyensis ATCC 20868]EPE24362.1 DHH phosphoesterase [Glarea lozoyensis ATCC 20868]
MPRPRTSLKSFLHSAKSILTAPSSTSRPPVTFVIGNESADVDSICSSILLAYLKTYSPHPHRNYPDTFYIPLSNIPRADLRLRPELLPVLKHAHLDTDDVLTLSDLPFPIEKDDGSELARDSKWFLVDHNVLTGSLGTRFGNKVVGIIDHHFNEYEHPLTHDPVHGEGRAIEGVGSCASLIIQHARKANMFPARNQAWDEELAYCADGF